jgi:hypothetical protein
MLKPKYTYMKKLVLFTLLCLPAAVNAQGYHLPQKGVKRAVCEYGASGDSLFTLVSQQLLGAGYTIDKRDKELHLITTEGKDIRHGIYKLRVVVNENKVDISSKWMTAVTLSFGGVKTEQTWYDVEMANAKGNIQNAIWREMMAFIEKTKPVTVNYAKQ